MKITTLELHTNDLPAQAEFYSRVLGLPVQLSDMRLEVRVGWTLLIFTQADSGFEGAYHFAFNIPENQLPQAKSWLSKKVDLLFDENQLDIFDFSNWNAHSFYFKDPAGNILEFIARHDLQNAVTGEFSGEQILCVSEIGLPSQDVITFASELCSVLGVTVFRSEPDAAFMPIGDNDGLFILPVAGRIWYPNTGVPAKLLPVTVCGDGWEVKGIPYEIKVIRE